MEKYSRTNNCDSFIATLTIVVTITLLFFGSTFNIGNSYAIQNSPAASLKTIASSVKITFPPVGQQVPVGNSITIFGTSKYNMTDSNSCAVYANVNNYRFQKATAVGSRGNNDYSSWIYTYVNNNLPIIKGINSLDVKLACNNINAANMTVYNTTRVVGVSEANSNRNQYYYNNYNNNNDNNILYHHGSESRLAGSSPPTLWFLGPSNNAAENNSINGISSPNTVPTINPVQQPTNKDLNISVRVLNDSVVWGNEHTVKISVYDRTSGQPLSNAIVTGNIVSFPAGKTGLLKSFVVLTNNFGEASYSWLVPNTSTTHSNYKISISASAQGYNAAAISTSFNGVSDATNNINHNFMQNKPSNNDNNNNNVPSNNEVSTVRAS